MIILYQMPLSHYCEKVRWALAYKKLAHKTKNLLPGLHRITTKKLTPEQTSVPILVDDNNVIYNSSDIINYLDETYSDHLLTPKDESLKQQALQWEQYADQHIGQNVKLISYHSLLNHPDLLIPMFTYQNAWYAKWIMKFMFNKLRQRMVNYMSLNDETVNNAIVALTQAIDKIHAQKQGGDFLVGDQFSRADMAVAALLAPLCKPKQYGVQFPKHYPEPLASTIAKLPDLDWVQTLYDKYR